MTQDDRIKTLAEQGWVATNIAQVLGMSEQVVRRKLNELGVKLPGLCLSEKNGMPYGMTNNSYSLRVKLGQILTDLMEKFSQPVVSSLTGLNRQEITRAIKAPYNHDWKLSQIERTLEHIDETI